MGKTATERLNTAKDSKTVVLHADFAGIKKGQKMFVGTPKIIDTYIRNIPYGETRTIARLRNEIARRRKCDAMCPVSTAIFIRIAAEAALERLNAGADLETVTPFWRLVEPDSKIARKLLVDDTWIADRRAAEQDAR